MSSILPYFKALHLVFMVTWFAALFYIVRLFIYQTEAQQRKEPERGIITDQIKVMSKRLWFIIGWPSAILTLVLCLGIMHPYFGQSWLNIKLILVAGLFIYHHLVHFKYKKLQKGIYRDSSQKLRVFNEVSTLFLFAIVFIAVLKNTLDMIWGITGLVVLALILFGGIHLYKKTRKE